MIIRPEDQELHEAGLITIHQYGDGYKILVDYKHGGYELHKDGVRHYNAPMPRRWHRCKAWSTYMDEDAGGRVLMCACGAERLPWDDNPKWSNKNSRRKNNK